MTGDTFKMHVAVVWVIVKSTRARLRLSTIRVTLEAGAVAQGKTQMIGLFEIANEVLDGIPSGHGFDDELVGVGGPDVAIDAFDLPLMEMSAGQRHHPRGVGHEVLEDVLVQMTGDAKSIILFEVIGYFHRGHKAHEPKG
jgi:hypothetical protein